MKLFHLLIDLFIYTLCRLMALGDRLVFRLVKWRTRNEIEFEEDGPDPDAPEGAEESDITIYEIDLGDLWMSCPDCGDPSNALLVGLTLAQDQAHTEGEHFDIESIGVIGFQCQDMIYSPCLTDKVIRIINAIETLTLSPDMFVNLTDCEKHGLTNSDE